MSKPDEKTLRLALTQLMANVYYAACFEADHRMSRDELIGYLRQGLSQVEKLVGKEQMDDILSDEGIFRP